MGKCMSSTKSRNIKEEEKVLVASILELANSADRISKIPEVVYDLGDGGMGSIKFSSDAERIYSEDIIQVNYIDSDSTPVIIALTVDNRNELFELDFWKVNFKKLLRYPEPNEINVIRD